MNYSKNEFKGYTFFHTNNKWYIEDPETNKILGPISDYEESTKKWDNEIMFGEVHEKPTLTIRTTKGDEYTSFITNVLTKLRGNGE